MAVQQQLQLQQHATNDVTCGGGEEHHGGGSSIEKRGNGGVQAYDHCNSFSFVSAPAPPSLVLLHQHSHPHHHQAPVSGSGPLSSLGGKSSFVPSSMSGMMSEVAVVLGSAAESDGHSPPRRSSAVDFGDDAPPLPPVAPQQPAPAPHPGGASLLASGTAAASVVVSVLREFGEKNKNNEWPSSTSIACYWCCHRFPTVPVGIPIKFKDGRYHVVGCFCSLECAAKHNFEDPSMSTDEMFERYALLNLMAATIYSEYGPVKPAPPRVALTMFGGKMSIEEFRAHSSPTSSKLFDVTFPPMSAMTLQIEEINQSDIVNDFRYIPIDNERITSYKERMKLRRTKPIVDHKNTLDHTMKLTIETADPAVPASSSAQTTTVASRGGV
jgi:hypothetical protein